MTSHDMYLPSYSIAVCLDPLPGKQFMLVQNELYISYYRIGNTNISVSGLIHLNTIITL